MPLDGGRRRVRLLYRIGRLTVDAENDGSVGAAVENQPREALLRRSRSIEGASKRPPVRINAGTHEPELAAIRLEEAALGGSRLRGDRLVHEPEDERRREQRQKSQQREE